MKISGIYQIQSKLKPKRIYIGSAVNIKERRITHKSLLKKNNHHNPKLQTHYNKYGESDLQFSILLGCDKEDLIKTEQYFMDFLKPWFNILPKAGNSLGIKRSNETKQKQRLLKLGIKKSEESNRKRSESMKGIRLGKKRGKYNKLKITSVLLT